ncbi:cystatin-1-like [Oculina patagonica]
MKLQSRQLQGVNMAYRYTKFPLAFCVVFAVFRVVHSATLAGGVTKIDQDKLWSHKELLEGLKQAVRLENTREPKPSFKFVYLPYTLDASSQVVQGTMYCVNVKIAPSKCPNALNETREGIEACAVDFLKPDVLEREKCCAFEIWSRPWLAGKERLLVQKAECKPSFTEGQAQPGRFRVTMKFSVYPVCNMVKPG